MEKQPANYEAWIERVSNIVGFVYPFEWKEFIENWLNCKWISYNNYMKEASEWWTYIHKWMENFFLYKSHKKKSKRYIPYIENGIKCLQSEKIYLVSSELHIVCKNKYCDFQWTIDWIWEKDWEKLIIDYKSYWLAKDKYWLKNQYSKPTNKLKKAILRELICLLMQ